MVLSNCLNKSSIFRVPLDWSPCCFLHRRQDVFDYIEMFYNPKCKHVRNGMRPPVELEWQQEMRTEGVK